MISIYADAISPRLSYVLDFVFNEVLHVSYTLTHGDISNETSNYHVYYAKQRYDSGMWIVPSGLLHQTGVSQQAVETSEALMASILKNLNAVKADETDFFSLIFFCLSRYEEYLPFDGDKYGRFESYCSVASRQNILHRAWIDEYICMWYTMCRAFYFDLPEPKYKGYHLISTIDVDQAWAYAYKGIRNIGGAIKDLLYCNLKNLKRRIHAVWNTNRDPFFTFDLIDDIHQFAKIAPVYFFLLGQKQNRLDKNHPPDHVSFKQLIKDISKKYKTGLHPSFASNNNPSLIQVEKKSLENNIDLPVDISRQHFLMLSFPATYRNLLNSGIKADYSMGYADTIGYRASTGHSFLWYDIRNEEVTALRVFPFQIMDVTLKNYMKLTPKAALKAVMGLHDYARRVNSPVCIIWHNSSLDEEEDWNGWTNVYKDIISHLSHG